MSSVFGDGRWNAQIPVLGDEARQIELLGEAHSEDTRPRTKRRRTKRRRPVRAEGPVVESTAVAQPGAIGTEAQGGDEDEVETDRGGEQLSGGEQRVIPGRFADSPSAPRLQAGHRTGDLAEHQGLADRRDDRQIDGAACCEKPVERRVEVRLSGQSRISKEGADRRFPDDTPRGSGHGVRR